MVRNHEGLTVFYIFGLLRQTPPVGGCGSGTAARAWKNERERECVSFHAREGI
jgi:hypothetical protein